MKRGAGCSRIILLRPMGEWDLPGGVAVEKQEVYRILNEAYFGEDCDERELFRLIEPLLREASTFVDIGASLGQYTRFASQVMKPGSTIVSIEADPIRFEELERNCSRWQPGSGIKLDPRFGAVSDREGPVRFYSTESNTSGGLFRHPTNAGDVHWTEIEAPGYTIDALFPQLPPELREGGRRRRRASRPARCRANPRSAQDRLLH